MLDLSSLGKAIASLNRGLIRAQADLSDQELRDGAIHRFEYTFELFWKMIKRQLQI
ncbi:MAG: nucleotidyltransferase substrate binding protein [Pseudomonadota bacterium]